MGVFTTSTRARETSRATTATAVLAGVVLLLSLAALLGVGRFGQPAEAAPTNSTSHPIPSKIPEGTTVNGVTSRCTDLTGFRCTAPSGYSGTSGQIGGSGWTTTHYWSHGSAGPGGSRHNCTTYVAFRLQKAGYAYPGWTDHADRWDDDAWNANPRVSVDQTPAVGSVAQWNRMHVAYVEEVTSTYIRTTSDNLNGGTDELIIPRNSTYMPDNFIHFKDTYEGKVVKAGSDVAVVVGGQRMYVANISIEICAVYLQGRERLAISEAAFKAIPAPLISAGHPCDLNKTILRASDKSDPKPSWTFRDGKLHAIPDGQTYQVIANTPGYRQVDVPSGDIASLPAGTAEQQRLYPPNYVGKMIRHGEVDYVVLSDQRRHRVNDYITMVCGLYDPTAPGMVSKLSERHVAGLNSTQVESIPTSTAPYSCSLNGRLLRAAQAADPKPSWVFHDGKAFAIQDRWTFSYYARKGWPLVDLPADVVSNSAWKVGGIEPLNIDPTEIPADTLINGNGIDYLIDAQRNRHRIPYIQDDVCWRNLHHKTVSASGLAQSQIDKFPPSSDAPCIIGDRVVKSDDGSSWKVDKTNTRHLITDTETFAQLSSELPVVGPWPKGDVNRIPKGADQPQLINKSAVKNSIVCRGSDGRCWAVDGNAIRHFIPSFGDDACWRWVNGRKVTRPTMNDAETSSLGEGEAWSCSMNGWVMATNEGPAYFMSGNTRRPIVDQYDYNCLVANGARQIRGISKAEADRLAISDQMPMCSNGSNYRIVSIRSSANGKYVSAEVGYTGNDYGMLRARNDGVGNWERFRLVGDCYSSAGCGIQSVQTRQFVAAEANYQGYASGELRARSGGIGGWETFRFVSCNSSGCAILANANGRYVANEMDFTGNGRWMLRARSTSIGGWERFTIG